MTDTPARRLLRANREAVLAIVDGLDPDERQRSIVPSGWTVESLLTHLGGAERYWCQGVIAGEARPQAEGLSGADYYREQSRWSEEILDGLLPTDRPRGEWWPEHDELAVDVESVVLHLVEETARHAGHLDIARELIDGSTGLGPR